MRRPTALLALTALTALLCGAITLPAQAGSSASSASSDASSASVGSVSTSLGRSSNSSTQGTAVADGDYRILEVAEAPARLGTLRLTLQAVADGSADGQVLLYLPQATAQQGRLAAGQLVSARQRSYGLEFAQGEPRQPFFLVLRDDWYQELQTRPVTL